MRTTITLLVAAFALKLAIGEWNYRAAMEAALVAAYGQRAAEVCRAEARTRGYPPVEALSGPGSVGVAVGSGDLDVWLWDVGNPAWSRRYRTAFLHLTLQSDEGRLQCAFDTTRQTAVPTR